MIIFIQILIALKNPEELILQQPNTDSKLMVR